jgi:hypothetical protein
MTEVAWSTVEDAAMISVVSLVMLQGPADGISLVAVV